MRVRSPGVLVTAALAGLALTGCSVVPVLLTPRPWQPATVVPRPPASPAASPGSGDSAARSPVSTASARPTASRGTPAALPTFADGPTSPDRRRTAVPDVRPAGFIDPPPGMGVQRYFGQRLIWRPCRGLTECATVAAPLDWADPDGQAITLAIRRARSEDAVHGALLVNPGGPGGSGQDFVDAVRASDIAGYDIVGWDPRGSGQSTPVACGTPEQTDALFGLDSSPDTPAEWTQLERGSQAFADQCRAASGPLLDHVSSLDTVQDMELLRQLLGSPDLNFLGVSYGTYLGALYAQVFPGSVGRMVLDSAVNISGDDSVVQAMGFDLALRNWADWCVRAGCGLGGSQAAVIDRLTRWIAGLDADPLQVGSRRLTQTLAATGVAATLYGGRTAYRTLRDALSDAANGDGARLLRLADSLNGRRADGTYDQRTYAFPAIRCLDDPDAGVAGARKEWESDQKKAPIFGPSFGVDLTCPLWTARPVPDVRITAAGAPAILVLGVTGDNATPYQQSVSMARQLASGVLVTLEGVGHGAFSQQNRCIDTVVADYLDAGTTPRDGLVCR